jgi:hypothetical protein
MKLKVVIVDLEIPPRVKKWALRVGIPLGVVLGGGAVAWTAAGLVNFTAGTTLTAMDLNNSFAYLQGEITTTTFGTRTPSAFRASLATPTTIMNSTNTAVTFDSLDYDLGSEYSTTAGTFTVAHSGIYQVHCGLSYSSAGGADWYAQLVKNGAIFIASSWAVTTIGAGDAAPSLDGTFHFSAGDVIKCSTFQSSGSAQPLFLGSSNERCSFSAARLY